MAALLCVLEGAQKRIQDVFTFVLINHQIAAFAEETIYFCGRVSKAGIDTKGRCYVSVVREAYIVIFILAPHGWSLAYTICEAMAYLRIGKPGDGAANVERYLVPCPGYGVL
jgi:hypothetical protein